MEGGGPFMDNEDNNNAEWAVGDGGAGGDDAINFWANVQQQDCHLSQRLSAGKMGVQRQGQLCQHWCPTTTMILSIAMGAASQNSSGQGPSGGAKASCIQIPRVLPCPSMTMQRTPWKAVCVQWNSSSVSGTAVRQCNHYRGKCSSFPR